MLNICHRITSLNNQLYCSDQQIQRRDDLEKRLKQQIQATLEQQRHRLMLLKQRYNLKALLSSVNQEQQNNLQLTNQLVKLLNSKILSYKMI